MGKKIRKLEVIKQYLKEKPVDVKPQYRSNPVLYLELLENVEKVKPELKKIPYIPKDISNVSVSLNSIPIIENVDGKGDEKNESEEQVNVENKYKDLEEHEKDKTNEKSKDKKYDDYRESLKYDDKKSRELEFKQRRDEHKETREERRIRKDLEYKNRSKNRSEKSSSYKHHSREHKRHRDRDDRDREHRHRRHRDREDYDKDHRRSKKRSKDGEEKTSNELKDMLRGSRSDKKDEVEIRRTKDGYELPPLLTDIENGKFKKVEKELNQVQSDQDKKRELLFRFEILKKSYKNEKIPDVSEYTDIVYLQKVYDDTVRRVALDSTVATYKKYFTIGLIATEYVLGSWLKFDMEGFVQQQLLSMNEYEKLLVELGEKSYLSGPSSWPVEVRLLALILMNAAMFIVTKMLMKKTGSVMGNIFGGSGEPEHNIKVKKKMRGPTIDVNDLPDTKSDFIGDDKGNNISKN